MKRIILILSLLLSIISNAQGNKFSLLIKTDGGTTYNGSELITDQINNDFEIGNNVVGNSGFDDNSLWVAFTGWAITGGKGVATATTANLQQTCLTIGYRFKGSFFVSDYVAGDVRFTFGLTSGAINNGQGNGIHYETNTCTGTPVLILDGRGAYTAKVDDVTAVRVSNYTGAGNHSVDSSSTSKQAGTYSLKIVASAAGDATTNYATLDSVYFTAITNGSNYRFQVYAYTSTANATLAFKLGDIVLTSLVSTAGMNVINFDFKATASTTGDILLYLDKAATVYIDEVSLKSGG